MITVTDPHSGAPTSLVINFLSQIWEGGVCPFLNAHPSTNIFVTGVVALIALMVGSFLNVVIYRGAAKYLPGDQDENKENNEATSPNKELSVTFPKNSFCPNCKHPLKWYHNIPLFSYIALSGQCAFCKKGISIQYPLVEAVTAGLITALWILTPTLGDFLSLAVMTILLICATGIDLKTFMIPNGITVGGTLVLLVLSPNTSGGLSSALLGTIAGGGIVYLCVELGKVLFGKKTITLPTSKEVLWEGCHNTPESCHFTIQDDGKSLEESERIPFSEIFTRESDYILMRGRLTFQPHIKKDGDGDGGGGLTTTHDEIKITPKGIFLDSDPLEPTHKNGEANPVRISGWVKTFVMPREAMGMGDVKLMAMVGAVMGALPAIHALSLAAVLGAIYGVSARILNKVKRRMGANDNTTNNEGVIAFGPWIALGSIIIAFRLLIVAHGCCH
jgi:leader peptidase (prepilin peptidase)/N-methyltransferase